MARYTTKPPIMYDDEGHYHHEYGERSMTIHEQEPWYSTGVLDANGETIFKSDCVPIGFIRSQQDAG